MACCIHCDFNIILILSVVTWTWVIIFGHVDNGSEEGQTWLNMFKICSKIMDKTHLNHEAKTCSKHGQICSKYVQTYS